MSDVFSDEYWQNEFAVTQADMDRLTTFITEVGQAQDLTVLVKRVIRGRILYGPDMSAPTQGVVATKLDAAAVKLWDPAGSWHIGDHAIFAKQIKQTDGQWLWDALVGEVRQVEETLVRIFFPLLADMKPFARADKGSKQAKTWSATVKKIVEDKKRLHEAQDWQDIILLEHGERIVPLLLNALQGESRFVRLSGRWFLRYLAQGLTPEQIEQVAWHLLVAARHPPLPIYSKPSPCPRMIHSVRPLPDPAGSSQPVPDAQPRPRTCLATSWPTPGSFTPRFPAYEPVSYTILCRPGIQVDSPYGESPTSIYCIEIYFFICYRHWRLLLTTWRLKRKDKHIGRIIRRSQITPA